MAGIVGVIGAGSPDRLRSLTATMLAALTRPEHAAGGVVSEPALGVHAAWLLPAGTFAAQQCAATGAAGHRLLLCGEARVDGNALGLPMRAGAAAPLDAAAMRGESFFAALNGLFCGLLIDPARGRVRLFNDRYGSERLYWHERDGLTCFASEAKALLAAWPDLRAFDDRGVADFLSFGSTLDGRTLFRDIAMLPGGSLWTFRAAGQPVDRGHYFQPGEWEAQEPLDAASFSTAFSETFRRTLPHYMTSAPNIGISLTGGLDTRMIMACLPADSLPSLAYTYAGPSGDTLDCRIGAQVARARGIDHRTLRVGSDFLRDYGSYVDRTVSITDGCAGALGAHEIYYASLAKQLAPIRLTGNFGSEVLRSMSTFKPLGLERGMTDGAFSPMLDGAVAAVAQTAVHPVTHAAFREIPWHLHGTLAAARSELTFRTPYLDNETVALAYRAPQAMRRSPVAALDLIAASNGALAAIPTDRGLCAVAGQRRAWARRLFAEATFKLDYLHKEGMPGWASRFDGIVTSFSAVGLLGLHKFLPYRGWFRRDLAPYLRDVVGDARGRGLPYWDTSFLASVVGDHVAGRHNRLRELNAIVTLEAVQRLLLRQPAPPAASPMGLQ